MRVIKCSSPFKRVRRPSLVHARARVSKHACMPVEASVEVYVSSILRLCTHALEYESGRANLRNSPQSYVEACWRRDVL
jgi:hypothetical protein